MSLSATVWLVLGYAALIVWGVWSLARRLIDHSPYAGPETPGADMAFKLEGERNADGMTSRN